MATAEDPGDEHVIFREYLDAVGLQSLASAEAAGLHASEWYALSLIAFHEGLRQESSPPSPGSPPVPPPA